jgi:hypothetical protein
MEFIENVLSHFGNGFHVNMCFNKRMPFSDQQSLWTAVIDGTNEFLALETFPLAIVETRI